MDIATMFAVANSQNLENFGYDNGPHHDSFADMLVESLFMESCGGEFACRSASNLKSGKMPYSIEYLVNHLPAVTYVTQFYLELIVYGGFLAGSDNAQTMLDRWLKSRNVLGQTNGNVLRQAILSSITYGYSGLRKVGTGLLYVPPSNFKIWKLPAYLEKDGRSYAIPGVWKPYFYEIDLSITNKVERDQAEDSSRTRREFIDDNALKEGVDGSFYTGEDPSKITDFYVDEDHFCHLRHSDEGDYGVSPLSTNRLMTTVIVDYLRNVDDEINNDGVDYMMYLAARSNVGSSLAGILSDSAANITINAAMDSQAKTTAENKQMEAARALARKMKRGDKTRMNLINKNLIESVEKMPGTVDLSQYQSIMNNAKATVADIYGIAAMLAGSSGGGWSTGMDALIKFTLEHTIVPFQQRYAEQLSPIIKRCAGIATDVHFKMVDWSDQQVQAEIAKLKSECDKNIAAAAKAKAEEAQIRQAMKEAQTQPQAKTQTTTTDETATKVGADGSKTTTKKKTTTK